MPTFKPTNRQIADVLDHVADLLEGQEANSFRVRAYRNGAQTVRTWHGPVADLAEKDDESLRHLPGIGRGLATWIREYVETGHLSILDRLEGQTTPEEIFSRIPGIGEHLAHEIHEKLGIEDLEDLEVAAHDGRLDALEGLGPRRIKGIQDTLVSMLSQSARRRARRRRDERQTAGPETTAVLDEEPSVGLLLEIDEKYRRKAHAGQLKTIAPRRFNPEGKSWLPVLRVRREGWNFTALYSNTALAHKANAIRDWVVIYFERDSRENQVTVVTGSSGSLAGQRVVRGRESECREYYAASNHDLFGQDHPGR